MRRLNCLCPDSALPLHFRATSSAADLRAHARVVLRKRASSQRPGARPSAAEAGRASVGPAWRRPWESAAHRDARRRVPEAGGWATVGVLGEKLKPRAAANGKAYSLWLLADLSGASAKVLPPLPRTLPLHHLIRTFPSHPS